MRLNMNINYRILCLGIASAIFIGCDTAQMQGSNSDQRKSTAGTATADASGATANDNQSYSYLADAAESAATDAEVGSVDSTVQQDLYDARLTEMVGRIIKEVDVDASGTLSLEEYLTGPEKLAARMQDTRFVQLSEEAKAKMAGKLTEEFNANAGEDLLLSSDELRALLVAQAPRVAGFRQKGNGFGRGGRFGHRFGPMGGGERPEMPSPEELFSKCDINADGTLDQAEFAEFMKLHAPRPPHERMDY